MVGILEQDGLYRPADDIAKDPVAGLSLFYFFWSLPSLSLEEKGAMSNRPNGTKYSTVRYWRYIFTPMLLFAVIFGLFMLFQAPDSQISSYKQVLSRADALISETGATTSDSGLSSILQNLQSLGIKPTAPPS